MTNQTPIGNIQPIGVFDSGIGGLSVLRHICRHLPHEHLLYFADSGFAPYGDKPEDVIVARTLWISEFLLQQGAKALVVACNTATAASIKSVRERYPLLPVVGVEPGLKPAAAATKTNIVGVLATERTLSSDKFKLLRQQVSDAAKVSFLLQACVGLADQVEKGELDSPATVMLLQHYVTPLLKEGADTLVLGCTHYAFVHAAIEQIAEQEAVVPVTIIDTGEAVARQLTRVLQQQDIQNSTNSQTTLQAFTSGSKSALAGAFHTLLQLQPEVLLIATPTFAKQAS
jgi:glutamate racemase